jgi:sulfite reductase (NADPH) flavoprotein alpha-component
MLSALSTENSPFSEGQIARLRHGLDELDAAQTAWLSGYLAGRLAGQPELGTAAFAALPAAANALAGAFTLEVLCASQTGNGRGVAETLARRAAAAGLAVRARSLDGFRVAGLAALKRAAFVISTHGDGDPPEEAVELFEYLESGRAADLSGLEFCVLALGDRSYGKFCEAGRRLEELLQARGARAFAPRVDCDVDFAAAAQAWSDALIEHSEDSDAREPADTVPVAAVPAAAVPARLSVVSASHEWTRQRPFQAEVQRLQKITGLESAKDVFHVELSLAGSGIHYQPGDALGVWPLNAEESVAAVLAPLGLDGSERVVADGETRSMHDWLVRHREPTRLAPDTVRAYAGYTRNSALGSRFAEIDQSGPGESGPDESGLREFIERRQFLDLVEEYPATLTAPELLRLLRPLSPRSYSIASSQAAVGDEVHLTVATLSSDAIGKPRRGVASDYLNHRLQPGDRVGVYLEANRRFRLPADRTAPLILIAAGTGIAPYRAFLQQLEAEGRAPDSWLIFGNPHLRTDFLYQREWLRWRAGGLLKRIDAAFSRDQADKRYVQHIVAEQAAELSNWLERGAHLYVCGGLAMGQAVERALEHHVAPRLVGKAAGDAATASHWLADLRRQRRWSRDLY